MANHNVSFLQYSQSNFNALTVKDPYTFYLVESTNQDGSSHYDLYLGNERLDNSAEVVAAKEQLNTLIDGKVKQADFDALEAKVKAITGEGEGGEGDLTLGGLSVRLGTAETAIETEKNRAIAAEATLEGQIEDVDNKVDAAQAHSTGVAGNLATETQARIDADAGLDGRIATLEGTIVGLSGAMHFKGVKNEIPADVKDYEQGDVIIVGNKEYVLNDSAFVEFGDATVNAEAITALTSRVNTAEGKITALEAEDADFENRIAAMEKIDHEHANKAELDKIVNGDKAKWDAAASGVTTLSGTVTSEVSRLDALISALETSVKGCYSKEESDKTFATIENLNNTNEKVQVLTEALTWKPGQ